MKIAFFEIQKDEEKFLKKNLKSHTLVFFKETINEINPKKYRSVDAISVFIYSKVSEKEITDIPKLKLILTRSTGFDHIDTKTAKKKGIVVGNVPFYGENTVAEHTFALLLNLSRNVHKSYLRTKNDDYTLDGLRGFDLKGKTLGVIGTGHIGMHVIRIAKGFGMNVVAYDIRKDTFISEVLNFQYVSIDELLKRSDIITLHMPYFKENHHFLNKEKLSKTKKGVIIINTARGPLIDTDVLYELLKKKHIGGAGLDVIEGEELIKNEEELFNDPDSKRKTYELFRDRKIFSMENVIFTPHIAFDSQEAVERILQTTIDNILSYEKSKTIRYQI